MTAAVLKRGARPPRAATARTAGARPAITRRQLGLGLAGLVVLALAGMILAGVPQRAWTSFVQWTAARGWEVRHVELTGAREQNRLAIYNAVLNGPSNAMLATDLAAVRRRLRALPWIADASVQRRLPDTLVIAVTERRPVALWQLNRQLVGAIDISGRVLARTRLERWNDLPILIGPQANAHVREALELIAATPLGRDMFATTLVGGRRWDVHFKTGEVLALPDQPGRARSALANFARLDARGPDRLLGGRFTRFDMRLPGRMIVAGPAVAETLAAAEKARRAAAAAQRI
ncbi:MAG: FtsQ-type POTRA domain-containing protein [Alphaproteobacteria bacterium]|nr:FtsQ-type POTRA domain-containing protein [Alphaproteobacteria bacterium]